MTVQNLFKLLFETILMRRLEIFISQKNFYEKTSFRVFVHFTFLHNLEVSANNINKIILSVIFFYRT